MTTMETSWAATSPVAEYQCPNFARPTDLFELLDGLKSSPSPSVGQQSCSTSSSDCVSAKFSSNSSIDLDSLPYDKACCWDGCLNVSKVTKDELLEHLISFHVTPQVTSLRRKYFYCMWHGCRVYKTPSVSSGWLERHVLSHTQAKNKPFVCIFNSCSQRFTTSELLERHVRRIHLGEDVRGVPNTDHSRSHSHGGGCNGNPNDPSSSGVHPLSRTAELSLKRMPRKKRKYRLYKFRAVDFYSDQAQCVVQDRLRLNSLIDEHYNERLKEQYNDDEVIEVNSDADTDTTTAQNVFVKPDEPNTQQQHPSLKHLRIRKILNTPHNFMGQRVSSSGQTEYLVHWCGDLSVRNANPSTWISEDDLQIAETICQKF